MKIYFDMDGVLADFESGVRELCGMEPQKQGRQSPRDDDLMFAAMREVGHFYGKLRPFPETVALLHELLELLGPEQVAILTGVPKPERNIPEASEDKRAWIRRHVASSLEVNTVLRRDKIRLAGSRDHILIDDYSANINAWEKAGGTGICHTSAETTRKRLVELGILKNR
ncbi:MAG: hypothetical protein IKX21_04975 [Deltaproteobacteria bacterium]|nr:hypothetical protein [Deltaproteobacteria bacterium]